MAVERATGAMASLLNGCDMNKHLFFHSGGIDIFQMVLLSPFASPLSQLHVVQSLNNGHCPPPIQLPNWPRTLRMIVLSNTVATFHCEFVAVCVGTPYKSHVASASVFNKLQHVIAQNETAIPPGDKKFVQACQTLLVNMRQVPPPIHRPSATDAGNRGNGPASVLDVFRNMRAKK